jgi:hypothetical protein
MAIHTEGSIHPINDSTKTPAICVNVLAVKGTLVDNV